jgi:hypothetical protein
VFATADLVIAPNYAHLGENIENDLSAQLNRLHDEASIRAAPRTGAVKPAR